LNRSIHFVLQAKGGIGKSFISALLAQFLTRDGTPPICFDIDQENTTFAHYAALKVEHLSLINADRVIEPRKFDQLMESLLSGTDNCVIDTGANTFSNFLAYLVEADAFDMLAEAGYTPVVHTIVGGADTLLDTANGFNSIMGMGKAPVVLWMNEHFGPLVSSEGKPFEETALFTRHAPSLLGVVRLRSRTASTYGDDIRKMTTSRLTFEEILDSPSFTVMEKSRLKNIRTDVFNQLSAIQWQT